MSFQIIRDNVIVRTVEGTRKEACEALRTEKDRHYRVVCSGLHSRESYELMYKWRIKDEKQNAAMQD